MRYAIIYCRTGSLSLLVLIAFVTTPARAVELRSPLPPVVQTTFATLLTSEFVKICVRTGANFEEISKIAKRNKWDFLPDAVSLWNTYSYPSKIWRTTLRYTEITNGDKRRELPILIYYSLPPTRLECGVFNDRLSFENHAEVVARSGFKTRPGLPDYVRRFRRSFCFAGRRGFFEPYGVILARNNQDVSDSGSLLEYIEPSGAAEEYRVDGNGCISAVLLNVGSTFRNPDNPEIPKWLGRKAKSPPKLPD